MKSKMLVVTLLLMALSCLSSLVAVPLVMADHTRLEHIYESELLIVTDIFVVVLAVASVGALVIVIFLDKPPPSIGFFVKQVCTASHRIIHLIALAISRVLNDTTKTILNATDRIGGYRNSTNRILYLFSCEAGKHGNFKTHPFF